MNDDGYRLVVALAHFHGMPFGGGPQQLVLLIANFRAHRVAHAHVRIDVTTHVRQFKRNWHLGFRFDGLLGNHLGRGIGQGHILQHYPHGDIRWQRDALPVEHFAFEGHLLFFLFHGGASLPGGLGIVGRPLVTGGQQGGYRQGGKRKRGFHDRSLNMAQDWEFTCKL